MKRLFSILFVFILIFGGCADKGGYTKFKVSEDEELAFDNTLFSKLIKGNKSYGVASALYLNRVYPQRYNQETFYIIIFAKDKKLLQNFSLTLNGKNVHILEKLPEQNEYAHLLHVRNKWSSYYLAKFPPQKKGKLSLNIVLSNKAAATLTFQKK